MLPFELIAMLEKNSVDNYDITINRVINLPSRFVLYIDILATSYGDEETTEQHWEVVISDLRDSKILFERCNYIDLNKSHPILWKYIDKQCELYFSGQAKHKEIIFVKMIQKHDGLFEGYLPFSGFLNSSATLLNVLESRSALIAKGPEKLLIEYADILLKHDLIPSVIGRKDAVYWEDGMFKKEPHDLKVLLLGNSYIIAREFEFRHL